ncbi:MAG: elongation factor G, partial [Acutalibacteraceae bacterium]
MKQYSADKIKNIVITGHGNAGKTSLVEAMLYHSGATDRMGKTADGTAVCDFDPEEIKRKCSVSAAVAPVEWKNVKFNLIDVPGLFDFEGAVAEGFRAAECALITISGKSGVSVGAEKSYAKANKAGMAKVIFVNKLNSESADFYKVFEQLKTSFGPTVSPIVVPFMDGHKVDCYINLLEYKAYRYNGFKATEVPMPDMGHRLEGLRTAISEAIAETDDELMEKYFSGEEFTPEEYILGLTQGVRSGSITPVYCGASATGEGIDQLMNGMSWLVPSASDSPAEIAADVNGSPVEMTVSDSALPAAIVFKTVADPFVGKLSYFKVVTGKISSDSMLLNMRTGSVEKIGKIYTMCGKKQTEAEYIGAGDIGAVAKLSGALTGDPLCAPARPVTLDGVDFPKPSLSMAVLPVNKGDEEKIAQGLQRLSEEDPSMTFGLNRETNQMIVNGQGEQHIDVIISKLKNKFGTDARTEVPRIAYRETIRSTVEIQGRYKKQSGGHGQYGDVWIRFEPCDSDGLVFAEEVVGGAVPKNFFPAVEKGLQDCMKKGTLAGYPVVGVKAVLYDGSYHPVDS